MSKVINKLYDFSRRGIRRQVQLQEKVVGISQTSSMKSIIDTTHPAEVDSEFHCFTSQERNVSDAGDASTSLSLRYLTLYDSETELNQRESSFGELETVRTTMENHNATESESLAWCRLLYNRSYSSSTNTSSSPGSYVTRKSSRMTKRLVKKSFTSKRVQSLRNCEDDVFADSPTNDSEHIYTTLCPSPSNQPHQQVEVESSSPTNSCHSEGNFSKRGQLKLVVCGSERRLTVTVLELRGIETMPANRPQRSVYIRLSLSPDAYEGERYKTSVNEANGQTANFHETFTFQLPEETTSRRLLISAWQRFEHRENSEFIGCMSFSVRKLKVQQKVIHGWYQLLGEILGRRKHLAARTMPENNISQGIRKTHKRDFKHRQHGNMTKSKSTLSSKLRPLAEAQLNARANENAIDAYYKNLFNFDGSPKEKKIPGKVSGQEKENVIMQQIDVKVVRRRKDLRTRNNTALRRVISETGRNERNKKRENLTSPLTRPFHQPRTPRRRGARVLSDSPNMVFGPAFVRSYRTKSARIISKHQSQLKLKLSNQGKSINDTTFRVLYSDELECQSSSSNFRPISISSQDDVTCTTSAKDLKPSKSCNQQAELVNCKTAKIIPSNSDVHDYLSIIENEKSQQDSKPTTAQMPAIQPDMMYVEPAAIEFDSAMLEHGLTLSRTGRVRAKKQHLRMAAYLESQKAVNISNDEREDFNISNGTVNNSTKNFENCRWKRISSKIDEDRGYCSEPEFDEDQTVELYRVQKTDSEMPPVFSPPPTILHSTHKMLEKFDHLDNLDTLKTQVELLTLNDVSRGPRRIDVMPKKRRRPSFLIALLQPFKGNVEKYDMSQYFTSKSNSSFIDEVPADLIPLLEKSSPCYQRNSAITPQDTHALFSQSNPVFGSSQSLCSERSYRIRREKSAMNRIRKLRKNKLSRSKFSSTHSDETQILITEDSVVEIDSPSRKLRSNSANEESTRSLLNTVNLSPPSMTLSRLPRSRKFVEENGGYVHLTRRHMECKSSDVNYLRDGSRCQANDEVEDINRKSNALGTLMTWFQRKSPDSRDSSPFGHRSASLSGRPSSTHSRRSRSFSRTDTMAVNRERRADSDETNDSMMRRNSFTNGRRSISKRSFRQSKRSLMDENAKPTEVSLEEMMKNKAAMQAFRDFLKSEYSEENLDFWLDCETYKTLKSSKQTKMAFKIFSQYLARSAPREVNIDFETRARTEERLKNPDKDTFVEPQNCIYSLMKCDSFRRFVASEKFLKLQPQIASDKNGFENRMNTLKIGFMNGSKKKKPSR